MSTLGFAFTAAMIRKTGQAFEEGEGGRMRVSGLGLQFLQYW